MTNTHRHAKDIRTEKKARKTSRRPASLPADSRSKKSLSMREGIAVWYDCCSCEAEPYWAEIAEETGSHSTSTSEPMATSSRWK